MAARSRISPRYCRPEQAAPASDSEPAARVTNGASSARPAASLPRLSLGSRYSGRRHRNEITGTITRHLPRRVYLGGGGSVTNGASGATSALIAGYFGVEITGTAGGVVTNSGTIIGEGNGIGVVFDYAGALINAAGGLINGGFQAVEANSGTTTIVNYGTLGLGVDAGVQINAGLVYNKPGALIEGGYGVQLVTFGTIINYGTIAAAGSESDKGIEIQSIGGGTVDNGGPGFAAALISGTQYGIAAQAAVTISNYGTILGTGTAGIGVALYAGSTLTNAGTITGSGGTAVVFSGSGNRLIVDPGAVFNGIVNAGTGGTLEFGSAAGISTLSGLGTNFIGFASVTVDAGAQAVLTGSNVLIGITLTDLGTLTNTGTLTGTGSLIVDPATLFNSGYIGTTVTLSGGGYLDNEATGTIAVAGTAVFGTLAAPTIVNAGMIDGTGPLSGIGAFT